MYDNDIEMQSNSNKCILSFNYIWMVVHLIGTLVFSLTVIISFVIYLMDQILVLHLITG